MVSKFKVGQSVRRIHNPYRDMEIGDIDTITYVNGSSLSLKKYGTGHSQGSFEIIEIRWKDVLKSAEQSKAL